MDAGQDARLARANGRRVVDNAGERGRVGRGGDSSSTVGNARWHGDKVGLNVGRQSSEPCRGLACAEFRGDLAGDGGGVGQGLLDEGRWQSSLENGEDRDEVLRRRCLRNCESRGRKGGHGEELVLKAKSSMTFCVYILYV